MTFTPIGDEQATMYRVATYLRKRYTFWTAEPLKPGEKVRIPFLKWSDGIRITSKIAERRLAQEHLEFMEPIK